MPLNINTNSIRISLMLRRYNNYGFRRFGSRRYGRFSRRRYFNRRRRYPLYRGFRSSTNRTTIKLAFAGEISIGNPLAVNQTQLFSLVDWSLISLSEDFPQYNQLYSTFVPLYFKLRWIPNIQSNASGYYLPGGPAAGNAPVTYNLTDGFSTTRYDTVDNPLTPTAAVQYSSFKTFNPARRWQTIVYPRRAQMDAPRQQFSAFTPQPAVNETIRGMGRLWTQVVVSWEDSNNLLLPAPGTNVPDIATQTQRVVQLGHFYAFFYMKVFDRK